jgi:hypothetical protein
MPAKSKLHPNNLFASGAVVIGGLGGSSVRACGYEVEGI